MFEISNLSLREKFRLNGTLSPDDIERLLDLEELPERIKSARIYISEAEGCYREESFLGLQRSALSKLHSNLRGANKETLGEIIKSINDDLDEMRANSEYWREQLYLALEALR